MCAPPSEKPLCFSCLSVCIVVQGKRHTQFLLRRFSIWRCPLYFIDLCKVDHSIQHWDQFQVVILNLFSEVFAAALNLFLPIKTKILIQLNPVILNTGIPIPHYFELTFISLGFATLNSHSVIPNTPLIQTNFCRRRRERQMKKKEKKRGHKLRST